jgi:molybdopterin-guanine dinucleotide biosynthesis protein A
MTGLPLPPTLGLVLAGGLARRMGGGDKARIEIGGISILDRVLATLSGQTTDIIINANGDPKRFADTGLEVVPDNVAGFAGPLAGILTGLDWLAAQENGVEWLVSVPGDCPFLPERSGRAAAYCPAQNGRRCAAGLRALGRLAPSGGRPVAVGATRGFA